MIPSVPRKRTPPPDQHTFQTGDGLTFWMDYVNAGAPNTAPTIRTASPVIKIILIPTGHAIDDVYLMHHFGTVIPFSRPTAASIMHDDRLDRLRQDQPDLDLVINGICEPFRWMEHHHRDIRMHDIPMSPGFISRAEQDVMTDLLCELLAPLALYGPISMARGDKPVGKVGFSPALQTRLAKGDFLAA